MLVSFAHHRQLERIAPKFLTCDRVDLALTLRDPSIFSVIGRAGRCGSFWELWNMRVIHAACNQPEWGNIIPTDWGCCCYWRCQGWPDGSRYSAFG